MGSRGGGGVSNAKAGGVPASSRKVVESLKEIVNCSDLEIYAMLVDCDMDPDETVSRLLSQGLFVCLFLSFFLQAFSFLSLLS